MMSRPSDTIIFTLLTLCLLVIVDYDERTIFQVRQE